MKLARFLLPVLLAIRAVPAGADTLTDLFPPDTKVVFGIRVHNLAISSVARSFAAQAQAFAAGWLKQVPMDGIDLLRDIDEVLIASSGKGPNPPAIVFVTGRLDMARLAGGAKLYRGVPLLSGEKETDAVVALLDGGTAVIGDPALVRAAIDRRGDQGSGKSRIDTVLNDRITSLRQRYDVWGLGEQAAGFVAPFPEAKVLESTHLLQAMDRFQFGMQLASGLELGAEIHARSPKDAEKLSAALGMMAALVKGQQTSTSATKSATKFDVQADGGSLNLTVSIPEEELEKIMEAETAVLSPVSLERTGQPAAGSAQPSEQPPTTPEPAQTAVPEAAETGPNGAPEAPPVAPAAPAPSAPSAPPAAPVAAPALAAPAATSEVLDKEGNTVVLTLPGKK